MPYVDLIPSVMPISLTSLANGATYRSEAFNVGDKMEVGIVIKADQALSVRVAYGASSDTAATAGTGTSASLPFVTSATSFASSAGSTEAGTYHSIAIPPSARKAQLVITNSSGSTANSITIDAALRRQAYPSSGGGGGITNVVDAADWPAGVSITELGYIGGLTSDAQTQINSKAASSHTHAASDIASGTVALARGGTNADLSATGGSGHVLKQASAGAAITVGAIAAGDLPTAIDAAKIANGNVSNTEFQYLDGVTSAIQTQLDGKLNDTGDTITGALTLSSAGILMTGTHIPAVGDRCLTNVGGGNDIGLQAPTTGNVVSWIQGNVKWNVSNTVNTSYSPIALAGGVNISSAGSSTRNIHGNGGTTDLYANVPTGGVFGVSANGTAQSTMGTGGLQFPTVHSTPATSVHGVWRDAVSTVVQGPTTGFAYLSANGSNPPTMGVSGTGSSYVQGSAWIYPAPLSLAAAATRTVMQSATTKSGSVEVMNTTDGKRATFSVENGTPVKIEGDASFVAGAPGASQIGLELSSTTLRINNGYAGAKLIAFIARLA